MRKAGQSVKKTLEKFEQSMNFNQFHHLCDKFDRTGKHLKNNDVLWKEVNPPQKVVANLATDATSLASAAITLNPESIANAAIDATKDILDAGKWVVAAGHAIKVKYKKHKCKHKQDKFKEKAQDSDGDMVGMDGDNSLHKNALHHQDVEL
ncbi:MAG: hypothetical protein K0R73_453 [Candidatus Midichloriaceae bacterium]|jgi:hypothetical protein|nr:hypothetical protein [Candidatus Midichloriaceae bacterium]